jgi:hypothetical protein
MPAVASGTATVVLAVMSSAASEALLSSTASIVLGVPRKVLGVTMQALGIAEFLLAAAATFEQFTIPASRARSGDVEARISRRAVTGMAFSERHVPSAILPHETMREIWVAASSIFYGFVRVFGGWSCSSPGGRGS